MSGGGALTQLVAVGAMNTYLNSSGSSGSCGSVDSSMQSDQSAVRFYCVRDDKTNEAQCIRVDKESTYNYIEKFAYTTLEECQKSCK